MSKKILSITLALILTLGMVCLPARAGYYENYSNSHIMAMLFNEGYASRYGKVFDYNGNMVRDMSDEHCEYSYFSEGLIVFRANVNGAVKYGYRDKNWNVAIEPQFDLALPFYEGLAAVFNEKSYTDDVGNEWDAFGYIDKSGAVVIPFRYITAASFREGFAGVNDYEKGYGYINRSGAMVMGGDNYYGTTFFSEGLAATAIDAGNWEVKGGYVDTNGKVAFTVDCVEYKPFCEGLAAVRDAATYLWGYIDKSGKIVIEPQFADVKNFSEGLAAVSKDGEKYGFIDKTGNMALPAVYEGAVSEEIYFQEGLCAISKAYGMMGYIDKTGKVVIEHKYTSAVPFKEGHALVSTGHDNIVLKNPLGYVPPSPPPSLVATPTASTVLVNGKDVAFDAYNINGNNYFKLRDLAYILSGSEKQFEVGWDGVNKAISLTSGEPYTAVGGEMQSKGAGNKTPAPSSSKIYLNGAEVQITAYLIDGNNYFKLRDVGAAIDFGVEWDSARKTIVIDTSKGYTPESN